MTEFIRRKDRGFLENILTLFVSITVFAGILLLAVSFLQNLQIKNKIDQTARRAILQLEANGYLDESTREELLGQLLEAGVFQGRIQALGIRESDGSWGEVTSDNPAAFGQKIEIRITGSAEAGISVRGENAVNKNPVKEVFAVRCSTGKN